MTTQLYINMITLCMYTKIKVDQKTPSFIWFFVIQTYSLVLPDKIKSFCGKFSINDLVSPGKIESFFCTNDNDQLHVLPDSNRSTFQENKFIHHHHLLRHPVHPYLQQLSILFLFLPMPFPLQLSGRLVQSSQRPRGIHWMLRAVWRGWNYLPCISCPIQYKYSRTF